MLSARSIRALIPISTISIRSVTFTLPRRLTPFKPFTSLVPVRTPFMPPRKRAAAGGSTRTVMSAVKDEDDLTPPPAMSEVESVVNTAVEAVLSRRRRTVKKPTYTEAAADGSEGDEPIEEAKPKRGRKRAVASPDELSAAESAGTDGTVEPAQTPKKKVARKKKGVQVKEEDEDGVTPAKKAATPRKPTPKKSRMAVKDEPEYDEDGNEVVKKKRKVKVIPKVVYDIPPIDRLETTFRGG
jgi:UV DNA damage endonuclease